MTREDIMRIAKEAGIKGPEPARLGFKMYANPERLERFAALVAAIALAEPAPPCRDWVGLTEPELHCINPTWPNPNETWEYEQLLSFVRAIEAALKEKNT